ncbi:MAG: hypothetical protein JSV09_04550 [Thermoplasmata archaeon]|nr:MAG: hypothetical protein JSV09_04550 [Thermoplasmata archaeon]
MGRKVIAVCLGLVMVLCFIVVVDVTMDFTLNCGGTILYVNETGSDGAYFNIQWAIDDANDGDTIFVYSGTYHEQIVINKSINLIGEDRKNTIIDANGFLDVIKVTSNWVNITGFTLRESGTFSTNASVLFY